MLDRFVSPTLAPTAMLVAVTRRLASLGGMEKQLRPVRRRRSGNSPSNSR